MTGRVVFLLALLVWPVQAHAQASVLDPDLAWPTHRRAADVVSTASVASAMLLDTVTSWQASDRRRAFVRQGIRVGAVVGASEIVKRLVHRTRPDSSDTHSFFSEHTALSFSGVGGARLAFVVPLGVLTGSFRMASGKHFLTDTLAGAVVGSAAGRWIR